MVHMNTNLFRAELANVKLGISFNFLKQIKKNMAKSWFWLGTDGMASEIKMKTYEGDLKMTQILFPKSDMLLA